MMKFAVVIVLLSLFVPVKAQEKDKKSGEDGKSALKVHPKFGKYVKDIEMLSFPNEEQELAKRFATVMNVFEDCANNKRDEEQIEQALRNISFGAEKNGKKLSGPFVIRWQRSEWGVERIVEQKEKKPEKK